MITIIIMSRKAVQQYRTTGTTQPSASVLLDGELGVSTNASAPKIFLKKTDGTIAEFIDKTTVVAMITELQDIIVEEQEVHAAALNDLNNRLRAVSSQLAALQEAAITTVAVTNISGVTVTNAANIATIDFENAIMDERTY